MKNKKRPLGPNVKALMFKIAGKAAVPDGVGLSAAVDWLLDSKQMLCDLRTSMELAFEFIDAVKNAPGPNPYGTDDEAIAKAIVERMPWRKLHHRINERTLSSDED